MVSTDAKKIMGLYTEPCQLPPAAEWIRRQLVCGCLAEAANDFLRRQPESDGMTIESVVIESVSPCAIRGRFPAMAVDHESKSPFQVDVDFSLNPLTGEFRRVDPA